MKIPRPQLIAVGTILVLAGSAEVVFAQEYQVSGTVSAADATPLADVSVRLKGANVACVTPLGGSYQLTAGSAADTLVFRKYGFEPVEVPITAVEGLVTSIRNVVHLTLEPQANEPRPPVPRQDTRPGAPADLQVRNRGEPLYLIDGVVSDAEAFNALSPNVIESIRVVRDAAALYRLGEAGRNGAVAVTTIPRCETVP